MVVAMRPAARRSVSEVGVESVVWCFIVFPPVVVVFKFRGGEWID